jgi:hypothetical protein
MNLVSMDIPDDPGELPAWLDRHLVGLDLAALVAELTAVHGRGQAPSLDEVLGSQRPAVLADGLAALPRPALRQLLRHPALLVGLQDLVLAEGGPYWEQLSGGSAALASLALHGERRLEEFLAAETRKAASPGPRAPLPRGLPARWYRRPWFVSLATAALVLITLSAFREPLARLVISQAGMETAWGWENLDLTAQRSPGAYLQELADVGQKWFDQRPDDPAALARRIGQMRQGCSRLIFASPGCWPSSSPLHAALLPAQAKCKGTHYAFRVACSGYDKNELRALPAAIKEIEEFRDALQTSGYDAANVKLLYDKQSDRAICRRGPRSCGRSSCCWRRSVCRTRCWWRSTATGCSLRTTRAATSTPSTPVWRTRRRCCLPRAWMGRSSG